MVSFLKALLFLFITSITASFSSYKYLTKKPTHTLVCVLLFNEQFIDIYHSNKPITQYFLYDITSFQQRELKNKCDHPPRKNLMFYRMCYPPYITYNAYSGFPLFCSLQNFQYSLTLKNN